uniref:NADH-ubiquinone oxidoreductase chain 4L n=1 Tax=Isometopus sp. TaxID=2931297 RepID=A0A8T9ZY30_9HEMI|nr:NADH dehydrogenase subunit 4L [Isometopus sp.]
MFNISLMINLLFVFMFVSGLLVFCFMNKHILVSLLGLEYLVLSIFMFFIFFFVDLLGDYYMILLFLVFSVCEGVLGLSVLVMLIRSHGNDFIYSLCLDMW